jgi:hypothetical protein
LPLFVLFVLFVELLQILQCQWLRVLLFSHHVQYSNFWCVNYEWELGSTQEWVPSSNQQLLWGSVLLMVWFRILQNMYFYLQSDSAELVIVYA